MINYTEAADKVLSKYPNQKIHTAWDFGSFYLFSVVPNDYPKDAPIETGTIFDAVDKNTGEVYDYDITSDVDAYLSATVINF